jgi:hypothetical protein
VSSDGQQMRHTAPKWIWTGWTMSWIPLHGECAYKGRECPNVREQCKFIIDHRIVVSQNHYRQDVGHNRLSPRKRQGERGPSASECPPASAVVVKESPECRPTSAAVVKESPECRPTSVIVVKESPECRPAIIIIVEESQNRRRCTKPGWFTNMMSITFIIIHMATAYMIRARSTSRFCRSSSTAS